MRHKMSEIFDTEDEKQALVVVPLDPAQDLWEEVENVQPETRWLLERLGNPAGRNVVVDLANVPRLRSNSNLLVALVALWKHLAANGKMMALCNVSAKGREVLDATKFDTLWSIYSSRTEALEKVVP